MLWVAAGDLACHGHGRPFHYSGFIGKDLDLQLRGVWRNRGVIGEGTGTCVVPLWTQVTVKASSLHSPSPFSIFPLLYGPHLHLPGFLTVIQSLSVPA